VAGVISSGRWRGHQTTGALAEFSRQSPHP